MNFRTNLTQFYINFSRQEHQIESTLVGLDQLLKCFGFSLYPFYFSFTVPLIKKFYKKSCSYIKKVYTSSCSYIKKVYTSSCSLLKKVYTSSCSYIKKVYTSSYSLLKEKVYTSSCSLFKLFLFIDKVDLHKILFVHIDK